MERLKKIAVIFTNKTNCILNIATMQKYLLFLFLLLIQTVVFAQAPTLQQVKANIDNYSANYPKEKIYLQFDKPAYSAGETIWFKAYLLKGFEISDLSKSFYID